MGPVFQNPWAGPIWRNLPTAFSSLVHKHWRGDDYTSPHLNLHVMLTIIQQHTELRVKSVR